MLSRKDDSWDVQFTEDGNYLLNFGWIYARPSPATVQLFAHALNQYLAHNEWDVRCVRPWGGFRRLTLAHSRPQQELLCKMVRQLGGREWVGENGRQHWWLIDRIGLRMFMLPLNQVRSDLGHEVNRVGGLTDPDPQFFPYHLEF